MRKTQICCLLCLSICFTFMFMFYFDPLYDENRCDECNGAEVQSNDEIDWVLEDIYVNFENAMNNYADFNRKMLRLPKKKRRVIIYTPLLYSGLNNRIFALITSFLFSYLTKRGFQMTEWYTLPKLFELPFENFIIPEKSKYEEEYNIYYFNGHVRLMNIFSSNAKEIRIGTQYLFTKQIFQHYNNDSDLLAKKIVYRIGNYADMARQFNHLMYNVFFKISQTLMKEYYEYKEAFTFNDKRVYKIGIHYRTGNGDFNDTHVFLRPNQHFEFINKALQESEKQIKLNRTVVWFIASDWSKAFDIFKNNSRGIKCVQVDGLPILHSKFDEEENHIKRTYYDMMFLSLCDYQILTSESSFSYAAFLLSKFSLLNITNKTVSIVGYKYVEPM